MILEKDIQKESTRLRQREERDKKKDRDEYSATAIISRTLEKREFLRSFALSYVVYLSPRGSQKNL